MNYSGWDERREGGDERMQMKDFFKKNGLCFLEGKTGWANCRILSKVRKSIKTAKRSHAVRQCRRGVVRLLQLCLSIYIHISTYLHYSARLHLNRLLNWTSPASTSCTGQLETTSESCQLHWLVSRGFLVV